MTETLIIGGGLAGLSLAAQLEARGASYRLVEARPRLGGRILSQEVTDGTETAAFDLGPAWFWGWQPRIAKLLRELNLEVFEQHSRGAQKYEDEHGKVHHDRGFASMEGSYRLAGGLGELIRTLVQQLPPSRMSRSCTAARITTSGTDLVTELHGPNRATERVSTRSVVLAIPPRVAALRVDMAEAISSAALDSMRRVPTWMAGHAKVLAVYARPFWREAGLSGDAISRVGPLAEVHDASPARGGPYALFGFVGVPAAARRDTAGLLEQARAQLVRLFGDEAADPLELILQDWAFEPETATEQDHTPPGHHPAYGLPVPLRDLCDGRLILASTEVASEFGGYLEGALESAERAAAILKTL